MRLSDISKVSDLTRGEQLFVARRRRGRDDRSITILAEEHGVSPQTYRNWELDREEGPKVSLGRLTNFDRYTVLRRRSGKTVRQISEEIGCSMWWYRLMEVGHQDDTALREYWS